MIVSFKDDASREYAIQCDSIIAVIPAGLGYCEVLLPHGHKATPKLDASKLLSIITAAYDDARREALRNRTQVPNLVIAQPAGVQ